jgi:hypothetical protein
MKSPGPDIKGFRLTVHDDVRKPLPEAAVLTDAVLNVSVDDEIKSLIPEALVSQLAALRRSLIRNRALA